MQIFVGIDNSSVDHKVRIINEVGDIKDTFTIENSFRGFTSLENRLKEYSSPIIGFELPHGPLVDFLQHNNSIMYALNPLKIKRFKESYIVSGNKNDYIDSLAIAEYMRKNQKLCRPLMFNSSNIERLKIFSITHSRLIKDRIRHINKLHFIVRQFFPLHEELFSNFACKIQCHLLLAYSSFTLLSSASDQELTNFLVKHNYRRHDLIERLISKIRKHQQFVSADVEYAYQFELRCVCKIILELNAEIDNITKEMNNITDSHKLGIAFKSLPGAGPVLSCKMLALFGDQKDRFSNYNQAQCLFGTAPKNYQSGNYHKIMMRKACNKEARAILYKYAFSSIKFSPWARAYYDKQKEKGKTHSVAIRALSNKWVRIIYRLWKDEAVYNVSKLNKAIA